MFIKNYQIIFINLLMIGTLIATSANSWFTAWMGLEINLMSMIPLMLIKLNANLTEASIKYFLAQAMASVILIFSVCLNFMFEENISLESYELFIASSLILKAGIAPLHFWFPQVMKMLNWMQCLIVFTWQKIAPLILISSLSNKLILIICAMTTIIGAVGGLNQLFLKTILTYSSIAHSGWMMMANFCNFKTWMEYFLFYCMISLAIIFYFHKNHLNNVSEIFNTKDSPLNKMCLAMNILSLGGMPPLLGFSAKLTVIISMIYKTLALILSIMIISSLISLFYYIRLLYSHFMINSPVMNLMNLDKKYNNNFFIISLIMNTVLSIIYLI